MSILGLSITETRPVIAGAGFWVRTLARLIDYVYGYALGLTAGVFAVIVLAVLETLSVAEPGWAARIQRGNLGALTLSLVGYVFYHTACEGLYGASLGKLVCGLRVLSEDLAPCRLKPAFLRSLAFYLDGLVFGVVGYLEMKKTLMQQRHGDRWAKTVVVRTSQVPVGAKRPGLQFLLAFLLGSAAWGLPLAAAVVWSGLW